MESEIQELTPEPEIGDKTRKFTPGEELVVGTIIDALTTAARIGEIRSSLAVRFLDEGTLNDNQSELDELRESEQTMYEIGRNLLYGAVSSLHAQMQNE